MHYRTLRIDVVSDSIALKASLGGFKYTKVSSIIETDLKPQYFLG